jgi:hypothetical protein
MKGLRCLTTVVGIVVHICGCTTTGTNGVVQNGPDTSMIGGLGKFTDFSGSAVKARLYQQAAEFCSSTLSAGCVLASFSTDAGQRSLQNADLPMKIR